jgi:hypothetical protein
MHPLHLKTKKKQVREHRGLNSEGKWTKSKIFLNNVSNVVKTFNPLCSAASEAYNISTSRTFFNRHAQKAQKVSVKELPVICHTERQVRFCDLLTEVAILRVGYYFCDANICNFDVSTARV